MCNDKNLKFQDYQNCLETYLGRKKKTIQKNKIDGKGLKKQKKILKNNKWFK